MNGTRRIFSAAAKYDFYIVLILLFGYFLVLPPDPTLPGLNRDEAVIGQATAAILGAGRDSWCFVRIGFGSRFLPLMTNQYTSALLPYLLLPFSAVFGLNLYSVRFMSAVIALVSLAYLYLLLRDWFGRQVALVALALIASHPVFVIYHNMAGFASEVYLACFFWAGLYHLYRFYLGRERRHLILAAFFCGLGFNKITFLWYIAGCMAAAAVLFRSLASKKTLNPKDLLFALPAFCAGSFLMIFYNLKNDFFTVRFMLSNLLHPTTSGVDNLAYFVNLKPRFCQFTEMLSGRVTGVAARGLYDYSRNLFDLSPNNSLFAVSLLIIFLVLMAKNGDPSKKKKMVFLAVLLTAIFLCSPLTVGGLESYHLYVLFFLPPALISVALFSLREVVPCKRAALALAGILTACSMAFNIAAARGAILDLRRMGGTSGYSTAINGLASWFDEGRIKDPVIVDGLAPSLVFLTGGRIGDVTERQDCNHESYRAESRRLLAKGADFYFVLAQKAGKSDVRDYEKEFEEILSLAKSHGMHCRVVKIIDDKSGQPEYVVWKIFRKATR